MVHDWDIYTIWSDGDKEVLLDDIKVFYINSWFGTASYAGFEQGHTFNTNQRD